MVCAPGQTDINFATVAELRAALAVDTPIALRVVARRPYLAAVRVALGTYRPPWAAAQSA